MKVSGILRVFVNMIVLTLLRPNVSDIAPSKPNSLKMLVVVDMRKFEVIDAKHMRLIVFELDDVNASVMLDECRNAVSLDVLMVNVCDRLAVTDSKKLCAPGNVNADVID